MDTTPQTTPTFRLIREVPLWGVALLMLGFAGQATALYYGQMRQTEKLTDQVEATKELTNTVTRLSNALSTKDLKDMEHDLKLADHERRLSTLELQRLKP